jgi:hypothetical protein
LFSIKLRTPAIVVDPEIQIVTVTGTITNDVIVDINKPVPEISVETEYTII